MELVPVPVLLTAEPSFLPFALCCLQNLAFAVELCLLLLTKHQDQGAQCEVTQPTEASGRPSTRWLCASWCGPGVQSSWAFLGQVWAGSKTVFHLPLRGVPYPLQHHGHFWGDPTLLHGARAGPVPPKRVHFSMEENLPHFQR